MTSMQFSLPKTWFIQTELKKHVFSYLKFWTLEKALYLKNFLIAQPNIRSLFFLVFDSFFFYLKEP